MFSTTFIVLCVLTAVLLLLVRPKLWWLGGGLAFSIVITTHLALEGLIGTPKPAAMEHEFEGEVIASIIKDNEGIYLYVTTDGEPMSYVVPWSKKHAKDLAEAQRRGNGRARFKRDKRWNMGEWKFYPPPVRNPLTPKRGQ